MGRLSLLLLGAAAALPPAVLAFVPPGPPAAVRGPQQQRQPAPLASSYYDDYDAQGARNMEQDRCVCVCLCGRAGAATDRTTDPLIFLPTCAAIAPPKTHHPLLMRPHTPRRPDWAGGGLVSNLVSALIGNKFLYGFMCVALSL